jgi:hypothetical protein
MPNLTKGSKQKAITVLLMLFFGKFREKGGNSVSRTVFGS